MKDHSFNACPFFSFILFLKMKETVSSDVFCVLRSDQEIPGSYNGYSQQNFLLPSV